MATVAEPKTAILTIKEVLLVKPLKFSLLRRPDMKAGDLVYNKEEDAGDTEAPGSATYRGGKLVSHLLPVAGIPPALVVRGHAVERRDKGGGEESRHNVADDASNTVDGKDIETLVDGDKILVLVDVEASCRCYPPNEGGRVHGNLEGISN